MSQYEAISVFVTCSNFFLGFCAFIGAAFVFQRSRRAALFFALAGLPFMLAAPIEFVFTHGGIPSIRQLMVYVLDLLTIVRYCVFFGGLALGMRTIAKESPS